MARDVIARSAAPTRSRQWDFSARTSGLFSKDIASLEDLFVHQAQDIFYAEQQILKALTEMIEKSKDPQLRQGLQTHLGETETHVRRMEQIFNLLGRAPKAIDCPAIDGIIKEANQVTGAAASADVLDMALIASAQAVEHYEIAIWNIDRVGETAGTQ
jgi:ferritin-like metal-binding protein YciE